MLRSEFTLNRTECNRVRHDARHTPKPLTGLRGVGLSRYSPASRRKKSS
jgi:hypothetical protein